MTGRRGFGTGTLLLPRYRIGKRLPTLRLMQVFMTALLLSWLWACGGGSNGISSDNPANQPTLTLTVQPNPVLLNPGTSVVVNIIATETNTTTTPILSLGQLPSGVTASGTFPMSIPPNGVTITFQASQSVALGSYSVALSGQAGTATAATSLPITVEATVGFRFNQNLFSEMAIPAGGSGQMQFGTSTISAGTADYNVALAISGLPVGTSATISPSTITPGQTTTVTISASSSAPATQNAEVTLVGTATSASVPQASSTFTLSVTTPASTASNRTDYTSTEGTPYAAAYDAIHNLIFSSNPAWNRVDIISNSTHAIVKQVSIPAPRGLDITLDNSTVWVTTASQEMFAINTTTFAAREYSLPNVTTLGAPSVSTWIGFQVYALEDGTLMLAFAQNDCCGYLDIAIWNPSTGSFTLLNLPSPESAQVFYILRTGDHSRVYFVGSTSDEPSFYYDVPSAAFSGVTHTGEYGSAAAVNFDGSRIAIYDDTGFYMYDGNFNRLGSLPGGGVLGTYVGSATGIFDGGMIFSPDNKYLYEVAMPFETPIIYTIDPNNLNALSVAPAMPMIPIGAELGPPFYMAAPFAVDSTGMLLSIQDYGIAFDDSTFAQNLLPQIGTPVFMQHMSPYSGPIAGGTTSGGFGNVFSLDPSVWYGGNPGTATLTSNSVTITSPPGIAPGPVNIKMLFPDGIEVFDPLFFSYGPAIEHIVLSGAPPSGDARGAILGFGMANTSGASLTIGASQTPVTASQLAGPFAESSISFTIPAGSPGYANVTVTTPDGSTTVPNAVYYAQSVQDYASDDSFAAILYDRYRNQLYLSAGNHIDVFDLTSNEFVAPLNPPSQGSAKQFAGLALTPDGTVLLATDLLDGSLAVIDPDNPTMSYSVFIAAPTSSTAQGINGPFTCTDGPLYVAAAINNQAYVTEGGFPGPGCGPGQGSFYDVDLTSKTVSNAFASLANCAVAPAFLATSGDGSKLAISGPQAGSGIFSVFDLVHHTCNGSGAYQSGAAFSYDGVVAASQWVFTDSNAVVNGSVARPAVFYNPELFPSLPSKLNDTGSLYYVPYPPVSGLSYSQPNSFFDIVDVRQGLVKMRFSLTETISDIADSLAIDPTGRHVYLLTTTGLTIVDLGQAPLSIGSFSSSSVSAGQEITVYGSGFTAFTTATVGGLAAAVSFIDENTLTITVPQAGPGPVVVTLSNSDGVSYTLQSGLSVL